MFATFYLTSLPVALILSFGSSRSDHHPHSPPSPELGIMTFEPHPHRIVGPAGELLIPPEDPLTPRLIMLIEGECEGLGAARAAQKHGLTRQRYYQLLKRFQEQGALALQG